MIQAILKRIFHFQEVIFLLSLAALACLPIALSHVVRDASESLLLPITLAGVILAWGLAKWDVKKISTAIILLFLGPLALFVRLGRMSSSLLEVIKQIFKILSPLYNWLRFRIQLDPTDLVTATADLSQRVTTLVIRLSQWIAGFIHQTAVEDPVARTLVWCLGLWLIAIWAGWQIRRYRQLLLGILPSTILLAIVLDYTGKETNILWIHLAMLLFLFGLNSYTNKQTQWKNLNIDYAESTGIDTLVFVSVLSLALVSFSYFSSTFSMKDFLENIRERRAGYNEARADSIGLQPARDDHNIAASFGGLPRSHLIGSGPELSQELVMTIITGDLPPMPPQAQPFVPRYYWRTLTYQTYTGSGWVNPSTTSDDIDPDQLLFEPPQKSVRIVNQQVSFPNENGQLYWTGTLLGANVPFRAEWNHKGKSTPQTNSRLDSDLRAATATSTSYEAKSMLLDVGADDLRSSPSVYPAWIQNQFLRLPESVPERVLSLARDLTAAEANPYDRALAIQTYLRQFPYTLDVKAPPVGRDVADFFLFDLKKGYCDYYATTMVVLARAAGLPARLVVGYANGFYNYERAEYVVTENYAHSWVEIYFADIGWVEFEPTAGEPVIAYQERGNIPAPTQTPQQTQPVRQQVSLFLQRLLSRAWIPFTAAFLVALIWFIWDTLRINRLGPTKAIELLFKRLRFFARPLSGAVPLNQTANQYALDLIQRLSSLKTPPRAQSMLAPAADEVNQLTDVYSRSLFAPSSPGQLEARDAIRAWSRLRWRLLLANLFTLKK